MFRQIDAYIEVNYIQGLNQDQIKEFKNELIPFKDEIILQTKPWGLESTMPDQGGSPTPKES